MPRNPLRVIPREVLDFSFGNTLEKCPKMAWAKYAVNRVADREDRVALDIGSAYHKYRENLTKALATDSVLPPELRHKVVLEMVLTKFPDPPITAKKPWLDRSKLTKACELAFEKVMSEKKQGRIVIQPESAFHLVLPSGRPWGGKIDEVFEWNKKGWIKDFKLKSWMLTDKELFALDHQMSCYSWAYKQLNGRLIADVIVEVMYLTEKNEEIKPLIATKTEVDHKNFIDWAEDTWDKYEKYLKSEVWPMHTSSCFDYMKRCTFFDMCRAGGQHDVEEWLEENSVEKIWDFSMSED